MLSRYLDMGAFLWFVAVLLSTIGQLIFYAALFLFVWNNRFAPVLPASAERRKDLKKAEPGTGPETAA